MSFEVKFVVTGCQFRLIDCQEVPQELSKQWVPLKSWKAPLLAPAHLRAQVQRPRPGKDTQDVQSRGHTHASTNNSFHVILKMFFSAWPLVISFKRQNLPGDFINYHKF